EGQFPAAWRKLEQLPPRADTSLGRDIDLLVAYGAYKSVLEMQTARRLLRPLYDDPTFLRRRPATAYYMGRTSFGLGSFADGVRALEWFVDHAPELAHEVLAQRLPTPP